jgi:hypothetical protein
MYIQLNQLKHTTMKTIKLSRFISELETIKAKTPKVINYDKICFLIVHSKGILSRGDLNIPVNALAEVIENAKQM